MTAVGIDVGKASLDMAVDGQQKVVRFASTRGGVAKLVKRLRATESPRIVVEGTGGDDEALLEACCDAGLWVSRVNPRQARNDARASGNPAKTDAIDARLLALMAREFAEHRLMDIGLDANSYFAMPYSSWQRGCNENLNGLVRQYIPKGCAISQFTNAQIQQIEEKLNQRPRKRLGYRTPQQLFELSFKRVALRS